MRYTLKIPENANPITIDKLNFLINECLDEFKFPFCISILFSDNFNHTVLSKETLAVTEKKKRYKIILHSIVLTLIDKNRFAFVYSILYHECLHIYDIYSIRSNPAYNFNPCAARQKNYISFILNIGFQFWTEYYAYAKTFERYKEYYEYKTLYQLAKLYKKIQIKSEKIPYLLEYEERVEKVNEMEDEISAFLYFLAKYAAGSKFGKQRNYKYCQKTWELKEYKYISEKLEVLIEMVNEMTHEIYGKDLFHQLYEIGFYIFKSFYFPLSFRLKKIDQKVYLMYYIP